MQLYVEIHQRIKKAQLWGCSSGNILLFSTIYMKMTSRDTHVRTCVSEDVTKQWHKATCC